MAPVQFFPWNKHVAIRAAGVGPVPFLHNHNYIPHVVSIEVYPEVGENHPLPPMQLLTGHDINPAIYGNNTHYILGSASSGGLTNEIPVRFWSGSGVVTPWTHPTVTLRIPVI